MCENCMHLEYDETIGISRADRERVDEVLHQTGTYELRKRAIGQLSGGQMQRVMLGRAIVNRPRLPVLDEPNSYIDKRFEEKLDGLLREINQEETFIITFQVYPFA